MLARSDGNLGCPSRDWKPSGHPFSSFCREAGDEAVAGEKARRELLGIERGLDRGRPTDTHDVVREGAQPGLVLRPRFAGPERRRAPVNPCDILRDGEARFVRADRSSSRRPRVESNEEVHFSLGSEGLGSVGTSRSSPKSEADIVVLRRPTRSPRDGSPPGDRSVALRCRHGERSTRRVHSTRRHARDDRAVVAHAGCPRRADESPITHPVQFAPDPQAGETPRARSPATRMPARTA